MSLAEGLHSVVEVLGSNQGTITMAVAAVVAIGSPFLDRWVIRRKRIQYQVLYNSKIGLDTVLLERDTAASPGPVNSELRRLVHQLERLSVMIIRIRNMGSSDIEESDIQPPLSVTFGNRVVWNARISEASDPQLRQHIRENLQFFSDPDAVVPVHREPIGLPQRQPKQPQPTQPTQPTETAVAGDYRNLSVVRRWLARRLADTLTPATPTTATEPAVEPEPQLHGVRLARLWIRRKQSFILVVVLHEAAENNGEISKDYTVAGGHANGRTVIDMRRQNWMRWPLVTTAIGVILVGAVVGTLLGRVVVGARPDAAGPGVPCVAGTANLAGSSAFGPIVQTIGDDYMRQCPGSHIVVNTNGSIDGVRSLVDDGPQSATGVAALSDGPSDEAPEGMGRQQVVVLVYALLVNSGVGVTNLSTDQVRGIYSGRYTNWDQLGGPPLPIRIVAREGSSGTRHAFEQYVLRGSEGELSSDDCTNKDLVANAPTILCEVDTTQHVVQMVRQVPGAIGYADIANGDTKSAVSGGYVVPVALDGRYPQAQSLPGYPFWTVEYLYTWTPSTGSPIGAFLDYLKSDSAQRTLRAAGYTPCLTPTGIPDQLCTER